MRINILSSAAILAATNAVNIESSNYPTVTYRIAPISPFIHGLYCDIYGEDSRFPPCDSIDPDDFSPYTHLNVNGSNNSRSRPEPAAEESADEQEVDTTQH